MNYLLFILLLIVIIVIASILYFQYSDHKYEGRGEFMRLDDEIIGLLKPYLESLQKLSGVKNLMTYLGNYYTKPVKKMEFTVNGLKELISEIIYEHDIRDMYEFIEKSNISYSCLLPDAKKSIVLDAYKYFKPGPADVNTVEKCLSDFVREEGISSLYVDFSKEVKKFLEFNRLYKFKDVVADWTLSKIKKEIKSHPEKVFEVDLLAMLPKLKLLSKSFKPRDENKESLDKIKEYLTELKIYGNFSGIQTLRDLERRLYSLILSQIDKNIILRNIDNRELEIRRREEDAREREREREAKRREEEVKNREQREKEQEKEREKEHEKDREDREKEREEIIKERQEKINDMEEAEMQEAFYRKIQEDPELENVAKAMGMTLNDLYEQYKAEKDMSLLGSGETNNIIIDDNIIQKIKQKLMKV